MVKRKMLAFLCAAAMVLGTFTGCGGDNSSTSGNKDGVKVESHKIGIAHYTDSGKGVVALKAYCEGISEATGCEFEFATLSTYDEATNLTTIQNLISSGCEGILISADMGTTAIVEECESADVYVGGFLCDFDQSYNTANEEVFGSEYFVGTVADGKMDKSEYNMGVADRIIENGYKHIGLAIFPEYAYPNQTELANQFIARIEEYNATVSDAEKIEVYEPEVLQFAPMEDTYLSEHPEMDCLYSIAAGASYVYPILTAAGKTDIKLYTAGFEGTDDAENFGTKGNQCYQSTTFSTPEAIVYPLCLMIDKLNGTSYTDLPQKAERVDCSDINLFTDEDMEAVVNNSIYYNGDYSKALITGEDIVQMCASYNPDATYADLCNAVMHLGVEDLK